MKKMMLCLILWLLSGILLLPIYAVAPIDTERMEAALPQEIQEDIGIEPDSGDLTTALKHITAKLKRLFLEYMRSSMAEGFIMLGISACCGLIGAFSGIANGDVLKKAMDMAAISAVAGLCVSGTSGVLEACSHSIDQLSGFSAVFIPIYGAAVAAAGYPGAALSSATATLIASNLLLALASKLLMPAVYLHIILSAAAHIAENEVLSGLAEWMRKTALGFFKYFLMLYTGYVSLSGLISTSTDAMALRTAKMTISGSVPVLGSVVSDVSEAMLSGAVLLKNAVGIYGFIGAVAICLGPFAAAGARLMVFKLLSLLASGMSGGHLAGLLADISESYSIALGLLGTCCAILFLSFVIGSVVIGG